MKTLIFILCINITLVFGAGGILPDLSKTPGDTFSSVMLMEICNPMFVRTQYISPKTRSAVFKNYNISITNNEKLNLYILDRLIPENLGGNAEEKNVWPILKSGEWNYWKKKELEKKLNWLVCNGKLSIREARHLIQTNWIDAYKMFCTIK